MDRRRTHPETLLIDIENEELGATHAQVGAAALGVMRFPAEIVEAIAQHHCEPSGVVSRLGRLLVAADALALAVDGFDSEDNAEIGDALEALEIDAAAGDALADDVRRDRENLGTFLH